MSHSSFSTLAARSLNTRSIVDAINVALIEDDLIPLYSSRDSRVFKDIKGIRNTNTDIPAFSHPIYIKDKDFFVVDTRTLLTIDREGNQRLSNVGDYNFQTLRAVLERHWVYSSPMDLLNLGDLPITVFMRWLGGNLSRKLGLSPSDQVRVSVVTIFYWFSLFYEEEFTEKEKLRIATRITQLTHINSALVIEMIDDIDRMEGIEAYCSQLMRSIDNTRMSMVSPPFIYAMLGGSWFGLNVKESIAVATEHPPTFLAMVSESLQNRGYRKTQIGTLVRDNDKRGRGDTFLRNLSNIVEASYD